MEPTEGGASAPRRAGRVQFRRGLTLLAMNTFLPGSAELATGRRVIGRLALWTWLLGIAALLACVGIFFLDRDMLLGWFAQGWVLWAVSIGAIAFGLAWSLLVVDALRLGRLGQQHPVARAALVALAMVIVCAIMAGAVAVGRGAAAAAKLSESVFTGGGRTETIEGRYNILLLGADDGAGREGARFDSINVVSVDAATGKAVMIGIPRNLEWVPFPESSPMHDEFPEGFGCWDDSCMINAINTTVENEYAHLYPGVKNPGIQATKEAVEELVGLTINYWVIIDLDGFQNLIDAVGGVRIALDKGVPIWWDATETKVTYQIGPGSDIHLNGQDALWFVRARSDSNDYVRMARQRCVMSAMLHQLDPATVLAKFTEIAAAGEGMVATDAPATEAGKLGTVALKVRNVPYDSVPLVPPAVNPGAPDLELVRRMVAAAVKGTEPTPTAAPTSETPTPTATPSASPTASRAPSTSRAPSKAPATTATPTPDPTPTQDEVEVAENCRPA